jgi:CO/xanthine dehydrogenase Mo-binding subunit
VPEGETHLAQADTDEVAIGHGTYASRSMMIGGSALRAAADIAFADGAFTIAGTDRSMPIFEVA